MIHSTRRRWLGAAAAGAAAQLSAPFWRRFEAHAAGESAAPVRLIVVCKCNGSARKLGNFALASGAVRIPDGSALAPLAPFADRLSVVSGMNYAHMKSANFGCHLADPFVLSARAATVTNGRWDGTNTNYYESTATPSLDRYVAARLPKTPVPAVALREQTTKASDARFISYESGPVAGKSNPALTLDSPAKAWNALFAGQGASEPSPVDRRQRDLAGRVQSQLALAYEHQRQRLGGAARAEMEGHLAAIEAARAKLDGASAATGCQRPPSLTLTDATTIAGFDASADLLVAAMRCDLTRVATFFWTGGTWSLPADRKGPATRGGSLDEHGGVGHSGNEDVRRCVDEWYVARFASLLARLDAVREGNGTMLDNSVVVLANRDPDHDSHSTNDLTWIVAGRAGGALATGVSLRWPSGQDGKSVPHARLLATLGRALRVSTQDFTDASPLPELLS